MAGVLLFDLCRAFASFVCVVQGQPARFIINNLEVPIYYRTVPVDRKQIVDLCVFWKNLFFAGPNFCVTHFVTPFWYNNVLLQTKDMIAKH